MGANGHQACVRFWQHGLFRWPEAEPALRGACEGHSRLMRETGSLERAFGEVCCEITISSDMRVLEYMMYVTRCYLTQTTLARSR